MDNSKKPAPLSMANIRKEMQSFADEVIPEYMEDMHQIDIALEAMNRIKSRNDDLMQVVKLLGANRTMLQFLVSGLQDHYMKGEKHD